MKRSSLLPYFIFFAAIIFFTLKPILNHQNVYINIVIVSSIIVFFYIYYHHLPKFIFSTAKQIFTDIVMLITPAVLTFYLNNSGLKAPLAAGIVGLLLGVISNIDKKLYDIQFPGYCGAFIGMSSTLIDFIYTHIIVASIISGLLFGFSRDIFTGFGGKLGTIAFFGVAVAYYLLR